MLRKAISKKFMMNFRAQCFQPSLLLLSLQDTILLVVIFNKNSIRKYPWGMGLCSSVVVSGKRAGKSPSVSNQMPNSHREQFQKNNLVDSCSLSKSLCGCESKSLFGAQFWQWSPVNLYFMAIKKKIQKLNMVNHLLITNILFTSTRFCQNLSHSTV